MARKAQPIKLSTDELHSLTTALRRGTTPARVNTRVRVQGNLNTHNASSLYDNLPPAEAFELAQAFEMHYIPKKGSWLNMAELELSALARICLSRRISSAKGLDHEIQVLVKERNELKIKVAWHSQSHKREKN